MHQGHRHVNPRLDGVKVRCGGPAFCSVCAAELAASLAFEAEKEDHNPPDLSDTEIHELRQWRSAVSAARETPDIILEPLRLNEYFDDSSANG